MKAQGAIVPTDMVSRKMPVLKPKLLVGRAIALAGGVPEVAKRALATLGARVEPVPLDELLGRDENRAGDWARGRAPLAAVVFDAGRTYPSPDPAFQPLYSN